MDSFLTVKFYPVERFDDEGIRKDVQSRIFRLDKVCKVLVGVNHSGLRKNVRETEVFQLLQVRIRYDDNLDSSASGLDEQTRIIIRNFSICLQKNKTR